MLISLSIPLIAAAAAMTTNSSSRKQVDDLWAYSIREALLQDIQQGAPSTELCHHGRRLKTDPEKEHYIGMAQGCHQPGFLSQLLQ